MSSSAGSAALLSAHRFCGMRRPSLVVQQNDDDLSRLAASPVDNNITFSGAHTNSNHRSNSSSSSSSSASASSSTSSSAGGDLGAKNQEVPEVGDSLEVAYLPKIIELEWQQHQSQQQQNHRKRKERLDSTSSNSQTDRKVGRSSNEEQSLGDGVGGGGGVADELESSANDDEQHYKPSAEHQPLLVAVEKQINHPSPIRSHHPHLLQHNLSSVSHHQYQPHQQHKKSNNNGSISSPSFLSSSSGGNANTGNGGGPHLSHAAWNNNVVSTGDDHYSDGEHERRRSSERFCRTRAPHGRKSSSCSSAKKSLSSSSSSAGGGGGGGRYLSKASALRHQHQQQQQQNLEEGQQGYKYDMSALKMERRGFIGRDSQKQKKHKVSAASEEIDAGVGGDGKHMEVASEEQPIVAPLPWNEFPDEMPVVCPRFAENTFDHVINVSDKFVKIHPPPKKESSSNKYVNNENMKTRDIMKKYGSVQQNNNNNAWAKNRNAGDLRLMIITPDERMRQISGRLTKLKKRIIIYEEGFERDFGHRPEKVDTMNDKAMKTIMTEIQKLKRERQVIKTCDAGSGGGSGGGGGGGLVTPLGGMGVGGAGGSTAAFGGLKEITQDSQQLSGDMKINKMQETLTDIEMVLQERRKEDNRQEQLDKLSVEQLLQEKTAVQKGLLYLEGMFGRPNSKEERDLARPLYDRYRQIKRMLNRNSSMISAPADLPTILEHEAMVFTSTNNTPSTDATPPESQAAVVVKGGGGDREELIATDDSSSLNDNLHQLSITELWHQLDIVRDEKKTLRRTIKEFEQHFEAEAGRKMLKGDRKAMEETYALYKQKKGRLRLLDALVKKHMAY